MKKYIAFKKTEEDTRLFIIALAQIIREGLSFHVRGDNVGWEIEITGS